MTCFIQTLVDALTSPTLLALVAASGAFLATIGGSDSNDDGNEENDEEEDWDDEDDDFDPDFDFKFSKKELQEFEEMIAQTNARITELVDVLDENPENRQEVEDELVRLYLSRAARYQEEEEFDRAAEDYAAAFGRIEEYVDSYGESVDMLKQLAAARLNYGILLNDCGDLDEADRQYALCEETNEKLAAFGDGEAKLDLVGVKLNRAAIEFERGNRSSGLNALDDAIEEFQRIAEADHERNDEACFYLAKALVTKADYLRAELDDDDFDSPDATEARAASKRAVDVYRTLVNAGHTNYKRDLADSLVAWVATSPKRSHEDVVAAVNALGEACQAFDSAVKCGEVDAVVDLFDATLQRADLLWGSDHKKEALAVYETFIETFDVLANSDELPMLEGLAVAYQRRAQIQKGVVKIDKTINDLAMAINLQTKIADDLIESLREKHECEHECECEHDHDHERCEHEHCGCGCGGCGEAERKFLVEKWVDDNFRALTECFYEQAVLYLEKRKLDYVSGCCDAARKIEERYREVLRDDEKLDMEFADQLRDLSYAL